MGAIFFYVFVYFVAYYASAILNMLTIRPLITNRYIAALLPVIAVALTHAYMMFVSEPPQGQDITVLSAILTNVVLPVIVVIVGAIYFMFSQRSIEEEEAQKEDDDDDYDDDDRDLEDDTESDNRQDKADTDDSSDVNDAGKVTDTDSSKDSK